jgi:hypothetical protein
MGDAVPVEFRIGSGPVKTGGLPIRNTRTIGVDENDIVDPRWEALKKLK